MNPMYGSKPRKDRDGDDNPIVGHKTFRDAEGHYSHEPIHKDEADTLWASIEAHRAERAVRLPDERTAILAMFDAYGRLRELGWREACYCPKDGTPFDVIEPGSTGIHPCFYSGEWPTGYFMVGEGIDCGPSSPILFRQSTLRTGGKASDEQTEGATT